jgi:hypothetical protein
MCSQYPHANHHWTSTAAIHAPFIYKKKFKI